MEKIIQTLIDSWTKGVDTYTHNGSTWLIFTDNKQWVIELTDSKTLWYNYNFFKQIFEFTSLDVVENQQYITKWVEDNVINKVKDTILEKNITEGEVEEIIENGVKETSHNATMFQSMKVEDTIQNGVRHILNTEYMPTSMVEDIIQSGVKHTEYGDWLDGDERLDDIVENGVKKTSLKRGTRPFMVKDTIKNGVKETNPVDVMKFFDNKMEDALQNGVKETLRASYLNVDNVIQDGVKETNYDTDNYTDDVKEVIREGVKETKGHGFEQQNIIDDIVKDGVKETKTPGKDGDILSTIEWMEENKSTSYTKMIDDVIDNGVKEVVSYDEHKRGPVNTFGYIDDIIKEGEKINGTYAGGQRQSEKCKSVVEYGTKNPTD
jgi:hypothetical protein